MLNMKKQDNTASHWIDGNLEHIGEHFKDRSSVFDDEDLRDDETISKYFNDEEKNPFDEKETLDISNTLSSAPNFGKSKNRVYGPNFHQLLDDVRFKAEKITSTSFKLQEVEYMRHSNKRKIDEKIACSQSKEGILTHLFRINGRKATIEVFYFDPIAREHSWLQGFVIHVGKNGKFKASVQDRYGDKWGEILDTNDHGLTWRFSQDQDKQRVEIESTADIPINISPTDVDHSVQENHLKNFFSTKSYQEQCFQTTLSEKETIKAQGSCSGEGSVLTNLNETGSICKKLKPLRNILHCKIQTAEEKADMQIACKISQKGENVNGKTKMLGYGHRECPTCLTVHHYKSACKCQNTVKQNQCLKGMEFKARFERKVRQSGYGHRFCDICKTVHHFRSPCKVESQLLEKGALETTNAEAVVLRSLQSENPEMCSSNGDMSNVIPRKEIPPSSIAPLFRFDCRQSNKRDTTGHGHRLCLLCTSIHHFRSPCNYPGSQETKRCDEDNRGGIRSSDMSPSHEFYAFQEDDFNGGHNQEEKSLQTALSENTPPSISSKRKIAPNSSLKIKHENVKVGHGHRLCRTCQKVHHFRSACEPRNVERTSIQGQKLMQIFDGASLELSKENESEDDSAPLTLLSPLHQIDEAENILPNSPNSEKKLHPFRMGYHGLHRREIFLSPSRSCQAREPFSQMKEQKLSDRLDAQTQRMNKRPKYSPPQAVFKAKYIFRDQGFEVLDQDFPIEFSSIINPKGSKQIILISKNE